MVDDLRMSRGYALYYNVVMPRYRAAAHVVAIETIALAIAFTAALIALMNEKKEAEEVAAEEDAEEAEGEDEEVGEEVDEEEKEGEDELDEAIAAAEAEAEERQPQPHFRRCCVS